MIIRGVCIEVRFADIAGYFAYGTVNETQKDFSEF